MKTVSVLFSVALSAVFTGCSSQRNKSDQSHPSSESGQARLQEQAQTRTMEQQSGTSGK